MLYLAIFQRERLTQSLLTQSTLPATCWILNAHNLPTPKSRSGHGLHRSLIEGNRPAIPKSLVSNALATVRTYPLELYVQPYEPR